MEKKTMGTFISALRRANGMTQQDLADMLNVSNKAVSRWERDECAPDLSLIPAIAEIFGITCDELLRGERIIGDEQEKAPESAGDAKAEKVRHSIAMRSIERFEMFSIAAIAMAFVGYIACLGIAYGVHRPIIGVCIMMMFGICAFATLTVEYMRLKSTKQELLGDEILAKKCDDVLSKYSFSAFCAVVSLILFSIPLALGGAYSVIVFSEYFVLLILMTAVVALLALTFKNAFYAFITDKPYVFKTGKKTRVMNAIQLILTVLCAVFYATFSVGTRNSVADDIFAVLGFSCAVLSVLVFILFLCIDKEQKSRMLIKGIRNIALIVLIGFTDFSSMVTAATFHDILIFLFGMVAIFLIFKVIEDLICKNDFKE